MQGTERFTTSPYKAVRRLIGVRGVLTIPYEAYNALLKLQAPTIPQPILLMKKERKKNPNLDAFIDSDID